MQIIFRIEHKGMKTMHMERVFKIQHITIVVQTNRGLTLQKEEDKIRTILFLNKYKLKNQAISTSKNKLLQIKETNNYLHKILYNTNHQDKGKLRMKIKYMNLLINQANQVKMSRIINKKKQ